MTSKPDVNSKNNLNPGLYLVATPIGNMSDFSDRARSVLKSVDLIACEDTRVTRKLLARYNIKSSMKAYHDHNADIIRPKLIEKIESGKSIGLVSDAGTPTISDPGYKLVKECIERELSVSSIPGANAAINGLIVSGLPTNRFFFVGFLSPKNEQKRQDLAELANISATLIFFESNRRLLRTLKIMQECFGDRPAAIAREMTKSYEEVRRGQLSDLILSYEEQEPPKGEIVVLVGGRSKGSTISDVELDQIISTYIEKHSVRDTTNKVAIETKVSKRRIYSRALSIKKLKTNSVIKV